MQGEELDTLIARERNLAQLEIVTFLSQNPERLTEVTNIIRTGCNNDFMVEKGIFN